MQLHSRSTYRISEFYWKNLNPNDIEYQLKAFETNVESDKMSDEIALSDITSYF